MRLQIRFRDLSFTFAGALVALGSCLAAGSARALPFHTAYGAPDLFFGLTWVSPTRTSGSIATGYTSPQGLLLKIHPDGRLDWVQGYDGAMLFAVRETAAGTFTWVGIGNVPAPRHFAPVIASTDATGTLQWSRALNLPFPDGTLRSQVYPRFLEIDPRDGGFWVGGELWRTASTDGESWFAKVDSTGNLLWAKVVSFPESIYLSSLFPTLDGGVIGVGRMQVTNGSGGSAPWMLAIKLDANGNFVWGFRYQVHNTQPHTRQWLSDIDRDPKFGGPQSAVVGTVTDFCRATASCDPLRSVTFVATLDERAGEMLAPYVLFSNLQPSTRGETIVMDQLSEVYAIGGEIAGNESGSAEGFLAFLIQGTGFIRNAMTYGDGTGLFDTSAERLARDDNPSDRGYIFLMNEIDWTASTRRLRRDLVRTDLFGRSGACEANTAVSTARVSFDRASVQPTLRNGWSEPIALTASPVRLPEEPCRTIPCEERAARASRARKTGARSAETATSEAVTILPGIPGGPDSRRGSTPLRIPPLQRGERLAGLAGQRGERLTFLVAVPEGTTEIEIRATGGKGNVDLLVNRGGKNGRKARSSRGAGNQESVRLQQPAPGLWSVTLEGTAAFEGVTLSIEGGA